MRISLQDRLEKVFENVLAILMSDGHLIKKQCLKGKKSNRFSKFSQADVFTAAHFNHNVICFGYIFIFFLSSEQY